MMTPTSRKTFRNHCTTLTCSLLLLTFSTFAFGQNQAKEIRKSFLKPKSSQVLVAAHRAVHHEFPENSIPAIKQSIDLGVDIIEIDVKVSKDGVPFLMHDRTIDRTTTGTGDPELMTWDELQQFNLIANNDTTDLKVPSLETALQLAKGKIMVDLDLKTDQMPVVLKIVRKIGVEKEVFFFDSEYQTLEYLQDQDKKLMLMPRAYSLQMADSAIQIFHPEVVHIDFSFYKPEVTDLIRKNKARIWINALGDMDELIRQGKISEALDSLLQFQANIIQTDEPALIIKELASRNLHN